MDYSAEAWDSDFDDDDVSAKLKSDETEAAPADPFKAMLDEACGKLAKQQAEYSLRRIAGLRALLNETEQKIADLLSTVS
jgi:hypothetical protein